MDKTCRIFFRGLKTYMNNDKIMAKRLPNVRKQHGSSNKMKVTLLGAGCNLGKTTSLMLKQSPYIDELCLYDAASLAGFANDLNYIDTKCRVSSYSNLEDLQHAVSGANLTVLFAHCQQSDNFAYSNLLDKNAPVLKEYAEHIARYAPKTLVAIGAEPIDSTVPMFSEIMKKYGSYNGNFIFGISTLDVVRANKFVAEILGLDPECVTVPMIGGHSEKTIVPVLSQASPCAEFTNEELEDITNSVRLADQNLLKIRSGGVYLAKAFATARFVISLVKALRGQSDVIECAYVRSQCHPQLKYMVTPILLGPAGVGKNLGIPELTDYETCLLENAIPILQEDIKKGEFLGGRPMEMVDGKLQDKPVCDPCAADKNAPRCPPDYCEKKSLFAD